MFIIDTAWLACAWKLYHYTIIFTDGFAPHGQKVGNENNIFICLEPAR